MAKMKRTFILGAGFSKPAGIPLGNGLLKPLIKKANLDEMKDWLEDLDSRIDWLSMKNPKKGPFQLNIEQVFHLAHFDIEAYRLQQHRCRVGRNDGETPWGMSESITNWLSFLEEDVQDLIYENDCKARLAPIARWARFLTNRDAVLTFNYDTLAERAITKLSMNWNHATGLKHDCGIPIHKLHGSIDWVVADRRNQPKAFECLFQKKNVNRLDRRSGHLEDDCCLMRCRTRKQLKAWIKGRDFQSVPKNGYFSAVGIAGLGSYKQLHTIPGLGHIWHHGMKRLLESDIAIVVGFSLSDFDTMAQLHFASVARHRHEHKRPLPIIAINPAIDEATKARFIRVFRHVEFVEERHENFDWSLIPSTCNRKSVLKIPIRTKNRSDLVSGKARKRETIS